MFTKTMLIKTYSPYKQVSLLSWIKSDNFYKHHLALCNTKHSVRFGGSYYQIELKFYNWIVYGLYFCMVTFAQNWILKHLCLESFLISKLSTMNVIFRIHYIYWNKSTQMQFPLPITFNNLYKLKEVTSLNLKN